MTSTRKALCYVRNHQIVVAGCSDAADGFACTAAFLANQTVHVDDGSGRGAPATCGPLEARVAGRCVDADAISETLYDRILSTRERAPDVFVAVDVPKTGSTSLDGLFAERPELTHHDFGQKDLLAAYLCDRTEDFLRASGAPKLRTRRSSSGATRRSSACAAAYRHIWTCLSP